ncbi:hypothetical protein CSC94_18310 [Zhengella mangrovi]|uniref:Lipoprotein n=1 Tax=Zhengella mangrovi TaxID=1982044 RepID=A0A2G1QK02_9HYPH|nr:hypothetical protein [Zhengella mangrovi]PHP65548.1 hypothetical protein CSC94_18310 [Zhengella mangrovi]
MTAISKSLSTGLCLLMIAAVAAGCGRRSSLETPYQASVREARDARKTGEKVPEPQKPEKNKPFILDPLIE